MPLLILPILKWPALKWPASKRLSSKRPALKRSVLKQPALKQLSVVFSIIMIFSTPLSANNSDQAPWGGAQVTATEYKPQKVVYDVHVKTAEEVESVLDRASYLSTITGADPFEQSIVLVLHGKELNFFAVKNFSKFEELMRRAQSLVESEALTIKMCKIAAQSQGYAPEDIHGFIEMIPMGDAEIIRLQYEEGHAYMQ